MYLYYIFYLGFSSGAKYSDMEKDQRTLKETYENASRAQHSSMVFDGLMPFEMAFAVPLNGALGSIGNFIDHREDSKGICQKCR